MNPISPRKKFLSLTARQVSKALRDKNPLNPIQQEFQRLVSAYMDLFEDEDEKSVHYAEHFLNVMKNSPIEAAAIKFAAEVNDIAQSAKEEEKISPDALTLIGKAAFGKQWQTPLAEVLMVSDRTMRRWVGEGAPVRIGRELSDLLSDKEESIQQARSLLTGILKKRPNLHLVKS